jgi:pyrimidine operon attenuation protein/uracil phosphoribosyltransferase
MSMAWWLPASLWVIWSGGAWLAERLQRDLGLPGGDKGYGVISSTLHRDDFGSRGLASGTDATQLAFSIDGRHIVLIDDVLFTGRPIRAVVNELYDFGRPASVELAVLVDRGGRELPIAAALAAARVVLPAAQRLSPSFHVAGVRSQWWHHGLDGASDVHALRQRAQRLQVLGGLGVLYPDGIKARQQGCIQSAPPTAFGRRCSAQAGVHQHMWCAALRCGVDQRRPQIHFTPQRQVGLPVIDKARHIARCVHRRKPVGKLWP